MKKVTLIFSVLFIAASTLFAQEGHKHGSPHGGEVKTAGGFHMEAVIKGSILTIYLLDGNEKPMTISGATASALIQTADGKTSTVILRANGKESFAFKLNPSKKYNKAIVTIKTGGKTASASFDLKSKAKGHEEAGHNH